MSLRIYIDTNIYLNAILNRDEGISKEIFTELIITDNIKDFKLSDICVISAKDFYREYMAV